MKSQGHDYSFAVLVHHFIEAYAFKDPGFGTDFEDLDLVVRRAGRCGAVNAAAIPDSSAVFPLPRPIDNTADCTPSRKAPRTKRDCQGSTANGRPASRPCETVKDSR